VNNFITLNEGWYTVENWEGIPGRWINSHATLSIFSDQDRTATLLLTTISFNHTRTLGVSLPDQNQTKVTVTADLTRTSLNTHLEKGENIIRFDTLDPCQRPADIIELNTTDQRCLGIAFQNISVM
jgi:hypothetical protein